MIPVSSFTSSTQQNISFFWCADERWGDKSPRVMAIREGVTKWRSFHLPVHRVDDLGQSHSRRDLRLLCECAARPGHAVGARAHRNLLQPERAETNRSKCTLARAEFRADHPQHPGYRCHHGHVGCLLRSRYCNFFSFVTKERERTLILTSLFSFDCVFLPFLCTCRCL